ncbi:tetratricopeptide repeat protein [Thalassoroseus pseudoceratinae]|uniref:tetratricopeptide repeat protein n=1 Tax=Thalassoroseus pseudoceratinae TaxID=2713176 RepID=UPI0014210270|nr:tetratricopeptide repeat protein [Thalassoroseus pseudoceratinae]
MFSVIDFPAASGVWILVSLAVMFWISMLVHCYFCEPDREFWFFTMLIIPPATLVYVFARVLFSRRQIPSGLLKQFGGKREIEQKRIAAEQIGNPHQHVEYGEVLRQHGRYADARDAYAKALEREPDNLPALWGISLAEIELEEYPSAKNHLKYMLEMDFGYKFGDVSLAYGKCLYLMKDTDAATAHLKQHINRWRHPEAMYLLAEMHADTGSPAVARQYVEAMFIDIDGSPKAIARKQSRWRRKGQKLLNRLPKASS